MTLKINILVSKLNWCYSNKSTLFSSPIGKKNSEWKKNNERNENIEWKTMLNEKNLES